MPKANKADNQNEDLAFEPALASLEQLVQQMESGELSLEQSIQAFEQGMKLSQQCQKALDKAEHRDRDDLDRSSPFHDHLRRRPPLHAEHQVPDRIPAGAHDQLCQPHACDVHRAATGRHRRLRARSDVQLTRVFDQRARL